MAAVLLALAAIPADAATPGSGSVTKKKKSTKWTGTFDLSYPMATAAMDCHVLPTPTCDHYSLKATLGEGAKIEIKVIAQTPCGTGCTPPADGDDIDLFVYDSVGTLVGSSTSATGVETVTFVHKKKNNGKPYDIGVRPWLVTPGHTYAGTVKVKSVGKG